jgi:hypothetical protein
MSRIRAPAAIAVLRVEQEQSEDFADVFGALTKLSKVRDEI